MSTVRRGRTWTPSWLLFTAAICGFGMTGVASARGAAGNRLRDAPPRSRNDASVSPPTRGGSPGAGAATVAPAALRTPVPPAWRTAARAGPRADMSTTSGRDSLAGSRISRPIAWRRDAHVVLSDRPADAHRLILSAAYATGPPAHRTKYVPPTSARLQCPCGVQGIPVPAIPPGSGAGTGGVPNGSSPGSAATPTPASAASSTSGVAIPVALRPAPTRPAILPTAPPTNAVAGQPVLLAVVITTAPAGRTLQFRIDGKVIAGCGAVAIMRRGGRAACKTVFIIPGDYQVTVTFKGGPGTATGLPILRVTVHSPVTVAGRPRVGSGVVTLLIGCAPGSGGCRLSALLGMAASGSVPGGQTAGRLGRASVRIPAGRTATLGVRLNPAGRALLAKRGILTVVQTIVLDLASRHIIVSRTTVTLRATPRASSQ